jgi:hypothetical protein
MTLKPWAKCFILHPKYIDQAIPMDGPLGMF